jgi:MFS family permease
MGWLLIVTASHSEPWFLYQVYTGRFLTGIAAGLVSTAAVVYVGETMDKIWRGVLITWPSIGKRSAFAVSTLGPRVSDLPHRARNTLSSSQLQQKISTGKIYR